MLRRGQRGRLWDVRRAHAVEGRGIWVDVRRRGEVEHCGRGRATHGGSVGREASIGKGGQTEEHPQEDPDYIGTCETIAMGCAGKGEQ